jgi:hypothetical protein
MGCKLSVSARVGGWTLAAASAAFAGLACVGCAATAKPAAAPSVPVSRSAAMATAAPSVTSQTSAEPANIVANATVRRELLAAFVAFRSDAANTPGFAAIPPSAVAGISPGTLYYEYDPANGAYWAVATFEATPGASQTSAFVGFQDGGSQAVFVRFSGGSWVVKSVGPCMTGLPVGVAAAWGLTGSPSAMCPSGAPAG